MVKLIFSAPVNRGALMEFFSFHNFNCTREYAAETALFEAQIIEWTKSEELYKVSYYDDSTAGLEYLAIDSDSLEKELDLAADVQRGPFQFHSVEAILSEFDNANTTDELVYAFAKLLISAPESCDPRFLRRIELAINHERAHVRAECLNLLGYISWPEVIPLVSRLRLDPDSNVRRNATAISNELRALELG